ncbi:Hypothetical predicted protein [Lecanosticta acicola]|uniref:KANL3/Tex30 alpha/beta hydrolase-like domain-containing protein n=1 Tax=Lecanosticta acicola TaxID=111012 RepID=A0AAI9EAM0_9PEZI|nr:Hypothetical predicted protein [Lecanosticta acicola]
MPKRKNPVKAKAKDQEQDQEQNDFTADNPNHSGLKDPTLDSDISVSANNNKQDTEDAEEEENFSHFTIPFDGKQQIVCERRGGGRETKDWDHEFPSLIFTHGAGGGIANAATRDFAVGFARVGMGDVVCYQGTMNLRHRVRGFEAVIENCLEGREGTGKKVAIGGRSMGARAAVLTALGEKKREAVEALILVSWPLLTGKGERELERREQILLDLPEEMDVLFILGSEDRQCPLEQFMEVRQKMRARSWVVEVKGADHGMSVKRKEGVQAVRRETGALAARWLSARKERSLGEYCEIEFDGDEGEVRVDGWEKETGGRQKKARKIE